MFKIRWDFITTACLAGFSTATAQADVFTFRAPDYRPASAESCYSEAQALRELFTAQTGAATLGAGCEFDSATERTNLIIRYEAPEKVAVVSTSAPKLDYEPNGFYADQTTCEADLARQIAIFSEETSIEPFLAFCHATRHLSPWPWSARIQGFGKSTRQPQRLSFRASQPYAPAVSALNAEIQQGFAQRGARVAALAWRPRVPHVNMTAFIYSSKELSPNAEIIVNVSSLEHCMAAREKLVASASTAPALNYLTSFCASPYSQPTRFDLTLVVFGQPPRVEFSAQSFAKEQDCQQALPRLTAEMTGLLGVAPLAGFCGSPTNRPQDLRAAFVIAR